MLGSASGGDAQAAPGDLNIGYDVVLFHGLCLEEEIDIDGRLEMLPFEEARTFVDEEVLKDMAPDVVRYRDWRLVGAVVKPFRCSAGGATPRSRMRYLPDRSRRMHWSFWNCWRYRIGCLSCVLRRFVSV
ncbi:MAG: hypothetical protein OYM47_18535 [Gemmatimonadota bacterium]|nr:hypothetical protein [Gemmatimonadota bacterium]